MCPTDASSLQGEGVLKRVGGAVGGQQVYGRSGGGGG